MGKTDALNLEMPGMATLRLYGDLQRFGKRFDLSIKTAAEGLHALYLQIPGLRQKIQEGWYQVRIAGKDVTQDDVTARLHEPLPSGAVIHIVPRMEGAKNGGMFQFVAGAVLAVVGYALGWTGIGAVVGSIGVSMMVGGIAQMLTPTPKSPTSSHADNGKASVYFSSVDNMIAQGNPVPIPYGEIMCGSRVISQEITTRDESTPDKVIHIGGIFGKLLEKQREALGLPITKPRVLIR
ncbi:tail assembly protein [Salmonella enterica subsp. diarizonae serovar 16:z10:e,n,x,z15]|uniref:Tail assembly protein n=1 Tax=Salmonella enterica I TaxID=59201 RepID=A0A7Z1PF13_SALET|nr:tail assembly protein [Salmonella enterica]MCH5484749.1 tail assembly protein [Salmonella enterica subsp. diarizonae serovar 16:z10:e,n,x,z15]EBJ3928037.1 tail assembly protein [Salmonella enterica]EGL1721720.1 tail assembly protein [Salmonella enterica]OHF39915.1 phage tail protein [Salmonella enterica subsp. diarizonae serovar 59:[k]:z35]PTU34119.1 tail assembly protein [Salmonella enterica subsp. enterica]